jgi:hypothetical protein
MDGKSESMDGITILERIVAEEGNCCWARPSICAACPLGRLARYDNGGFMSCVEALNIDGLSEEEADSKYKLAAINKLADLTLNEIIEAD